MHWPDEPRQSRRITTRELAEKIIAMIGSSSKLTFTPLLSDDPMQRKPDISLARRVLDWEPKVSLEQGL